MHKYFMPLLSMVINTVHCTVTATNPDQAASSNLLSEINQYTREISQKYPTSSAFLRCEQLHTTQECLFYGFVSGGSVWTYCTLIRPQFGLKIPASAVTGLIAGLTTYASLKQSIICKHDYLKEILSNIDHLKHYPPALRLQHPEKMFSIRNYLQAIVALPKNRPVCKTYLKKFHDAVKDAEQALEKRE